ncbi:hypothetical protein J5226_06155 [Lysobacter sp. K5869]|uniref:hypothetical protein n=1 Tax=Lysobacter sp. K5869 TaxID=2820808 RepID=UPI001C060CDE|nr:hypothetical protein [Lysobacter sp. K5869]QWP77984.1 hypothetical protein J5226_06155 [Lysobacter sp. K5869]
MPRHSASIVRRGALSAALLPICLIAPACLAAAPAGFGFNYWPRHYQGCEALTPAQWPAARTAVAADLDQMKSLGASVVRLSLYMETSGFRPGPNVALEPDYCHHLPDLLTMVENAGLKTIIAFSNTYLYEHNNGQYYNWQDPSLGYAGTQDGYWRFTMHSKDWIDRMVALAGVRDSILYYDIQNEYDSRAPEIDYYFRTIYSQSKIPPGKRGISILQSPFDVDPTAWRSVPRQLQAMPGATLAYVEFHSYPTAPFDRCPLHGDIEAKYDEVRSRFAPGTQVVLGEFGRPALAQEDPDEEPGGYPTQCRELPADPDPDRRWDEPRQRATELDLIGRAAAKGIPYFLHWMLWDDTPARLDFDPTNPRHQVYGYGYGPHAPKDVVGALAERYGLVANADFESAPTVGQPPQRWDAGSWNTVGSAPAVLLFVSGGAGSGEAATGDHYARLQTQQACATCTIWMQADAFDIGPNRRLHFNAYLRSNLSGVQLKLVQYDANWNVLAVSAAPAFTPSGWSWNNYAVRFREQNPQLTPASWSVTTAPGTARAILTVGGTPATAPALLDIDAVSVSAD